jgi:acyl-CoA reductase-like NAD-dependent aldehyde dehydrogenase
VAETTTGKVPSALPPGWRNVCGIIAALTLAGTLATGTNSVLKIADHQARTSASVGALAALQAALLHEGVLRPAALEKAKADLETIRLTYDEYFP